MLFKRLLLVFFGFIGLSYIHAQSVIKGRVVDELSGELLEGAIVKAKSVSAQVSKNGTYTLNLPMGEYQIVASLEGYNPDTIYIQADRNLITDVNFALENLSASIQAVQIVASVAKDRKTPIAYSNLSGKEISERLGSADMPMLLNNTPGVYATQQGGGSGDARITIRGFSQRNIAVMIDGIPVNDMENGWVYWSNWFGLSGVTALTQVQRGLGSSRIANPAVGGTMNIITKGITRNSSIAANVEVGDSRYQKFSLDYSSGRLKGDWGIVASLTKRSSTGYVDGLFDDMYAYFIKVEKEWGKKHSLSFTAIGAPQSHGQRSFKARLSLYDDGLARQLGMDTVVGGMPINQGRKYNQHWGYLDTGVTLNQNNGQLEYSGNQFRVNERVNQFHKPQVYLKYDYKPNAKWFSNTIVYMSQGNGGGTAGERIKQAPNPYGNYNFQSVYEQNIDLGLTSAYDPKYSNDLRKSSGILLRGVNNHRWYGLLNTTQYKITKRTNLTGGIDLRTYRAEHYREVYDLIGGDYFIPDANEMNPNYDKNHLYKKGDIFNYHNDGLVRWAGAYLETEYTKNQLSAFFNVSGSQTAYQRVDYFKKDSSGNAQKTPWVNFSGYTLKTGANYNFTRKFNTFVNLGYLNRPTRFNNVFDNRNTQIQDAKNEIVYALEGGSGYKNKRIALNLNAYYTLWENRPVDFQPTFRDADDNPMTYNINGLKARHMGAELQAAIKAGDGITLEFSLAAGDWIWRSGSNATVRNDAGDSIGQFSFDATGVHVGDAAQNQVAGLIRWEPTYLKGAYFSLQYVYFGKHFADFEPIALRGDMAGKESFKIPNYWYMNFNGGYAFDLKNSVKVRLYFNISNMTNNLYISDAQHRSTVGDIGNPSAARNVFNPRNLEVFVSQGLRYTTGIRVSF
jgi:hypothetical protein